jgi:hypothetical protein
VRLVRHGYQGRRITPERRETAFTFAPVTIPGACRRYMKRVAPAVLVAITCLGLLTIPKHAHTTHGALSRTVFTVSEVLTGLAQSPRQWQGRTVLVRGWLQPYCWPPKGCRSFILSEWQPGPGGRPPELALNMKPDNPLVALARHMPLVGSVLFPVPQPLMGKLAVYRLRFLPRPHCTACSLPQNADAPLLDAQPY